MTNHHHQWYVLILRQFTCHNSFQLATKPDDELHRQNMDEFITEVPNLLDEVLNKTKDTVYPSERETVDTLWIESMNTVVDEDKLLTIVSVERISTCISTTDGEFPV